MHLRKEFDHDRPISHPRVGFSLAVICLLFEFHQPTCAAPEGIRVVAVEAPPIAGPLRVSIANPRYFCDAKDRIVYLTGSHNWRNLLDWRTSPEFDYTGYLDLLQFYHHNLIRLWSREGSSYGTGNALKGSYPELYLRTGPGLALDGRPKFDLGKLNPAYFDRLRLRVREAHDRRIYVMVMLFHGFAVHNKGGGRVNPWPGHPFNANNNVNGIDGDANGNGEGEELHTLQVSAATKLQEAYVRKVVETVNDLDVIYEISNESHRGSVAWQYHMIDLIHEVEKSKLRQNPVLMSAMLDGEGDTGADNSALFASPAEAVSPGPGVMRAYRENPPPSDGSKVVISDTDHLWGVGGDVDWVWKSFLRGLNPIFMDPLEDPTRADVRRALGLSLVIANRVNLAKMAPRTDLASSAYCLTNLGSEYLVYLPSDSHWLESRIKSWMQSIYLVRRFSRVAEYVRPFVKLSVEVDLSLGPDRLNVTWFNPSAGTVQPGGQATGGRPMKFTAPFKGPALLHLTAARATAP